MSESTGRELELHNYLLAHGAKQVSNFAHTPAMQGAAERLSNAVLISTLFWSEKQQQRFWIDTLLSCDLLDNSDIPIKVLAGFVLRQAVWQDAVRLPMIDK